MFDIGFWELATIAVIGIVVVGPDRLPEVVRTIAIYVRKLRRAISSVKNDIERELDLDDIRRQMQDLDMQEHIKQINQSVMDLDNDVRSGVSRFDEQIRRDIDIDDDAVAHHSDDVAPYAADEYADTGVEPAREKTNPPADQDHDRT